MNYNLEIQKLLLSMKELSDSKDKILFLKQAINIADTNKDIDWGYDLRLNLISEETNLPYFKEGFPAFAWVLETLEANPGTFDERNCLWLYKWAATAAYSYASIPYSEIEKILSDMKSRLHKYGYSLRGYYSSLIYWEVIRGNLNIAEEYFKIQQQLPRDILSDDPDFELDTKIEIALLKNNFDEAISLSSHFKNNPDKGFFPFATNCYITYYLNKVKDNRAAEYYENTLIGLGALDKNIKCIVDCVSCIINHAAEHKPEKGFHLFQEYSYLEFEAMDSMSFIFSKNILSLFRKEQIIELNLSPKLPFYQHNNIYNTKDLFSYYYNRALLLATNFDNRNQTNNFHSALKEEIVRIENL